MSPDSLWLDHILPLEPPRSYYKNRFHLHGLAGLYHCMSSTKGMYTALRSSFIAHCEHLATTDSDNYEAQLLGQYATFTGKVFTLRDCVDEEVYRHTVHHLSQYYLKNQSDVLAKKLLDTQLATAKRTGNLRSFVGDILPFQTTLSILPLNRCRTHFLFARSIYPHPTTHPPT